jgi:hypothetical protein
MAVHSRSRPRRQGRSPVESLGKSFEGGDAGGDRDMIFLTTLRRPMCER